MKTKVSVGGPGILTIEDLKRLDKFHISKRVLEAAKLDRLSDKAARAKGFSFKDAQPDADFGGVEFPYLDVTGYAFNSRIRRDHPEIDDKGNEENKYLSLPTSKAGRRGFYILPADRAQLEKDPTLRVLLVEAEKSVLAVASWVERDGRKLVPVGMGGCYGWRGLPDEELALVLGGRPVGILLDANVADNKRGGRAELELASETISRKGRPIVLRLPRGMAGVNGADDFLAVRKDLDFKRLLDAPPVEPWLDVGVSWEEYDNAKPPRMFIKDILQEGGVTMFGGLPSAMKTWVLLSIVRSLLTGEPLFGYFPVEEKAERIIYLTPEISLPLFKRRLELTKLGPFIKSRKLLIRTLSQSRLELNDDMLLLAAPRSHVFLDTVIRFIKGDENENKANDTGLAAGCFGLLERGALSIIGAHHARKSSKEQSYMTLESVLRGAGDLGAFVRVVFGLRKISKTEDIRSARVLVECVKPGDFNPPAPFVLEGRPHIDEGKGLQITTPPGQVDPATLAAVVRDEQKKGGRKPDPEKKQRAELMRQWVKEGKTKKEIVAALKAEGMKPLAPSTLQKEMSEALNWKPPKY
jgi:hypothetical protein